MLNHRATSFLAILVLLVLAIAHQFVPLWMGWYLLVALLWLGITVYGSFTLRSNYFLTAVTQGPSTAKKVAITFDDGPNSTYTPQVLQLLAQYNAKATFFCIGKRLESQIDLAKQMVAAGHELGNHSYSHSWFFDFFGKKRVTNELKRTNALVSEVSKQSNNLVRPPYGVTNPAIAKAISETNNTVVGWNVRSFDTVSKDPKAVINRLTKKVQPGAIILLHDSHDRIQSILEHLLLFLQQQGYEMVTVNELLYDS